MLREEKQTHEEKVKMYRKCKKAELIEMLISANEQLKDTLLIHQGNIPPVECVISKELRDSLGQTKFYGKDYNWMEADERGQACVPKGTKVYIKEKQVKTSPIECEITASGTQIMAPNLPEGSTFKITLTGSPPDEVDTEKPSYMGFDPEIFKRSCKTTTGLTLKKAIKLSIMKWKWIVKKNGSANGLSIVHPELENLIGRCGLCELYYNYSNGCPGCPLIINGKTCGDSNHPWFIWSENPTKANAQKMLDLIKNIKTEKRYNFKWDKDNKVVKEEGDQWTITNVLVTPEGYMGGVDPYKEKPKLTLKKAIKLSIMKWKWIVKKNGSANGLSIVHPELNKLVAFCGLCELYNKGLVYEVCSKCPLIINGKTCGNSNHPWFIWSENPTKANAQKMLDAVKEIQYEWKDLNKKDRKILNIKFPFTDLAISVRERLIINRIDLLPSGAELYVADKNKKQYKCSWDNGTLTIKKRVKRK